MSKSFRTGDQSLVREFNRAILLNLLRTRSPQSRSELAATSGLNKTTVSSLVSEFLEVGLAREMGMASSAGGRPAVMLELNPTAGCIIGVELGVGYALIVLTDFRADILWRHQISLDLALTPHDVLTKVIALVRQAVDIAGQSDRQIFGLGLGTHGLVDINSGMLLYAPNLGWRDVLVRNRLQQAFPFPVFVDNDAKASALGELYFGVAQNVDNFVFVIGNVGLGVGVVLGGQVHRGATGSAGEVGHTTLVPDGPLCRCGNRGCWETLASYRALLERLRTAVAAGGRTVLPAAPVAAGEVTMPQILEAARTGDALVLQALEETGVYLGMGIANLINAFNPSLVVFGGVLSLAADYLLPAIHRTVAERAMPWPRQAARILISLHRFDICVMGAVALVLHDMLSHPRLDVAVAHGSADRKSKRKELMPKSPLLKNQVPTKTNTVV